MNKKYIIIIVISVIALILIGVIAFPIAKKKNDQKKDIEMRQAWQKEESHTTDLDVVNKPIVVYTKDNEEIDIETLKDKPMFIVFWSKENTESIEVIKRVNNFYDNYKEKVNFLLISVDQEPDEKIESEISAPIYYDFYQETVRGMEVSNIPAIVTIKGDDIENSRAGLASSDMIEANLELLVENYE